MRTALRSFAFASVAVFVFFSNSLGAAESVGFAYAAITDADLPSLKLNHYFDADKKHQSQKFQWTFTADGTFEVSPGEAAIPPDLRQRLAGVDGDKNVGKITGKWRLDSQTSSSARIEFSDVKVDGEELGATWEPSYRIYRTAPAVIRIGEPQYVFEVEPNSTE